MAKKKSSHHEETWKALTYVFGTIVVILFATLVFALTDSSQVSVNVAEQSVSGEDITRELVLGNPEAPITIVEFSDLECPFCEKFYSGAYQDIKEQYVETGKVKFIYKHFPLERVHPKAMGAAIAMECAADQGKGFELHDLIFERGSPTITNLKLWAAELALDTDEFVSCLDSNKYEAKVRADLEEGVSKGVRGTPTIYVGDEQLVGAQPFSIFKKVIDEQLNQ